MDQFLTVAQQQKWLNFRAVLTIVREGARKMLHQAIEAEVEEFMKKCGNAKERHVLVKRSGYLPEREIQTGIGPIKVKKPRIKAEQFTSAILPKYMRRAPQKALRL